MGRNVSVRTPSVGESQFFPQVNVNFSLSSSCPPCCGASRPTVGVQVTGGHRTVPGVKRAARPQVSNSTVKENKKNTIVVMIIGCNTVRSNHIM